MRYCQDCGTPHECINEQRELDKTRVEMMRLETNRDIEVARINAGAARSIAATEAEHSADHAEGVAEGMETALDAVSGGGDPAPVGDPIVIDSGDDADPEPDLADDVTPPVVIPEPREPKSNSGWWDGYASKR